MNSCISGYFKLIIYHNRKVYHHCNAQMSSLRMNIKLSSIVLYLKITGFYLPNKITIKDVNTIPSTFSWGYIFFFFFGGVVEAWEWLTLELELLIENYLYFYSRLNILIIKYTPLKENIFTCKSLGCLGFSLGGCPPDILIDRQLDSKIDSKI